ncbi:apelin receptor A-like [Protopterus annectens]|uniref:apelin receptor A-like n=1 Tax=Protopterus annectens TaxID=7888 RepID=UPI001CFC0E83|nr:apelin receptor A-like [Protopterus annectens]
MASYGSGEYIYEYDAEDNESYCNYQEWPPSLSIIPVLYMTVFVLGLSGNGLVIFTVWKSKPKRRSADTYIGNLALADLAFVVTLPLWAVYTALNYHWPFGSFLCKLSSYLVLVNMYASVFCLTCLSFDRYLAIVHSLTSSRLRSRDTILASLGIIWTLSAVLALPAFILRKTKYAVNNTVLQCDMDFSDFAVPQEEEIYWLAGLGLSTTLLGFVLPFLLMTVFYCFIGRTVTKHFQNVKKEDQKKKRLLKIISTLVVVFAICWLPFHVLKTAHNMGMLGLFSIPCPFHEFIIQAHSYATFLAYLNSCLNPFLYAFFDLRFRSQCYYLLRMEKAGHRQISSLSSTMSGQTQKSEIQSLATKV